MRDFYSFGITAPVKEDQAKQGDPDYFVRAAKEGLIYILQLRRMFGKEPDGAILTIRRWPTKSNVVVGCYYDNRIIESLAYVVYCDFNGPDKWDSIARQELCREGR